MPPAKVKRPSPRPPASPARPTVAVPRPAVRGTTSDWWAGPAAVALGAVFGLHRLIDPDLFLQVAVGRAILADPTSIGVSSFIQAFPAYRYVEDKWLSSTIAALVDALGGAHGLMLYQIALAALVAGAWYFMQRAWRAMPVTALLGVCLALLACNFRLEPRPDTMSHGLLALLIGLVGFGALPLRVLRWVFPAVLVLWVNLHGYFVNGLLVLFAAAVATTLRDPDLQHAGRPDARTRFLILGIALGACLLHPQGWRALLAPIEQLVQLRNDPVFLVSIAEFSPTTALFADLGPWRWALLAATVVGAVAFAVGSRRPGPLARQTFALVTALPWLLVPPLGLDPIAYRVSMMLLVMAAVEVPNACRERYWFRVAILGGFTMLAAPMVRNVPLVVPAALVLLAPVWSAALDELARRFPSRAVQRFGVAALLAGVGAVAWMRLADRLGTDVRAPMRTGWGIDAERFPVGALDYLAERSPSALLNNFDNGGYLLYRLHPQRRAFIAGNTSMYPLSFLTYYRTAVTGSTADLADIAARFAPRSALVDFTSPASLRLATALATRAPWQLVYLDRGGAVFTVDDDQPPVDVGTRARALMMEDGARPTLPSWLGGRAVAYPSLNFAFFLSAIGRPDLAAEAAFRLWPSVPSEDVATLGGNAAREAATPLQYVPQLEEAVRRYPGSEPIATALFLGLAFRADRALGAGKIAEAEADLQRMLVLQPQNCGPYFVLAKAAVMKQDTASARRLLTQGRSYDRDGVCLRASAGEPLLQPLLPP